MLIFMFLTFYLKISNFYPMIISCSLFFNVYLFRWFYHGNIKQNNNNTSDDLSDRACF